MVLHDTVPSFYDPAIPIDFKIKKLFFCKNEANSDCSSYSFFYRQHLSCEGFLPPLSTQPSLACSLPFLARGCLPTLIKPRFPVPSIPTQTGLHWNSDKLEHCMSKKCKPGKYHGTNINKCHFGRINIFRFPAVILTVPALFLTVPALILKVPAWFLTVP